MSDDFLARAWQRLGDITEATAKAHKAGLPVTLATAEVAALAELADMAIGAVERDGCVPGSLCHAVVKYARRKA